MLVCLPRAHEWVAPHWRLWRTVAVALNVADAAHEGREEDRLPHLSQQPQQLDEGGSVILTENGTNY
jgi:hypothetical protein